MGLGFTNRADKSGPAVYLLSNGTHTSEKEVQALANEITERMHESVQVIALDGRRGEGGHVADFYDVTTLPCVLIVMDDDQLYHSWMHQLPTAADVSYMAGQAGARRRGH